MFSSEKAHTTKVNRQQQTAGTTFFRKAGEDTFFRATHESTFFSPTVQAKLTVSSPDDPQEKEADSVADQVMRMPEPVSAPAAGREEGSLQKKEEGLEAPVQTKLATAIQRSYLSDDMNAGMECGSIGAGSTINRKHLSLYPSDVLQRSGRGPPAGSIPFEQSLSSSKGGGSALPNDTRQFMESRFNADFSGVRIHTGSHAEGLSTQIHAHAFTHGNDIYFNNGKYSPNTASGGLLLAHELTHTIQQGASRSQATGNVNTAVARKPIIQRSYGAPVSQLDNAIQHAKSQEGKINANKEGEDGNRTGWQTLLEIFKSTFGEDKIVSGSGGTAVPGTVSEMDIKKKRTATGVAVVDPGNTDRTMTGDRDAMPSWCGIFVFWALNKSGVPMPKWKLGQSALKPESLNPPGALPKPGDIAWRQAYSHFAIVESVSGDTVRTVNGNTAGEDNLGGQVQSREHPISNWTAFFNPLATMEGSLGNGEGPVTERPKTLSELRRELFHVSRKEESEQEESANAEQTVQPKNELSNWSVNSGGELVQPKEEEQKEEDDKESASQTSIVQKQHDIGVAENTEEVQRSVIDDALGYIGSVTDCISLDLDVAKGCALQKAQQVALHIPGYRALRVVLGRDPITNDNIDRNGRNFLEAAFDLMPGGLLLHQKLEEQHQLDAAAAWIDEQIARVETLVNGLFSEIETFWNRLGLTDLGSPMEVLRNAANIVLGFINRVIDFAVEAATELLDMIKEYLLTKIVDFIKTQTTAYPLLRVILGRDPVTDEEVPANGTTILNALLELGGEEGIQMRTQMQQTGTFRKAVDFIDEGISLFSRTYDEMVAAFHNIWNIVTIGSLMDPVGTFTQIYNQFAGPVSRVLDFVLRVGVEILKLIKEVLMQRLSAWAREQRGYELVTVLIGKDPFTDVVVPRNVENIIRGFMSLMEGGREQFDQLKESGAIDRTVAKVNAAVARLNMTPAYIVQLFIDLWNSFSINDLANPIAAFQRIIDRFGEPIGRLVAFVIEIVKIVIEAILIIMNFPFDLINNIIAKAMQAYEMIKRDPVGFLKNLLRAIKQGFIQFFNNILQHLLTGLVGWLTSELRDAGVPAFSDTSLRGIISWVLQVLGISMDKIWEKLAAHPRIGPQRVARIRSMINTLEGIWTFIRDVQERGMAAIWERLQEQLSNLWNTILDAVKNWIMEQIVNRMVTRLLSMLDPTGIMAVVNSVVALYNAIQSFIKYLREMLEIVNSFVEGVVDIASGNITTAANYLERTLARAVPIVIGFLANQVGLSGIGHRVGEMIGQAQQMVDQALTWLVNRAVDTGMALLDRVMGMARDAVGGGGTPQERLDNALRDGQGAVNRFAGSRVGRVVLNPLLTVIRLRYGLQVLEVVPRGANWAVRGVINPEGELPTNAQADGENTTAEHAVDKEFTIGDETHTIRAETNNGRTTLKMASATFFDLVSRIEDIERFHVERFRQAGDVTRANDLHTRLDGVVAQIPGVVQRADRARRAADGDRIVMEAIDTLSAGLATVCREFGIRKIVEDSANYQVPPSHSPHYGSLNSDGQASSATATLSWKSREHMRSTDSGGVTVGGVSLDSGYDKGHLLAASLGGSNSDTKNYAPMSVGTNRTALGMVRGEGALRTALNASAYPPYIIEYTMQCNYGNSKSDLQSWLDTEFGAAPTAAANLYRLAKNNTRLTAQVLLTNIGGAATLDQVTAAIDEIREQLKMHYMPTSFSMSLLVSQGENLTLPSVGTFNNHQ